MDKKPRLGSVTVNGHASPSSSSSYFKSASSSAQARRTPSDGKSSRPRPMRPNLAILSQYTAPKTSQAGASTSGSAYTNFAPGESSSSVVQPTPRTAEQQKRHEAWERRLADPGGIVPRRRSLALDQAAAAALRGQLGDDEDSPSGQDTPGVELIDVDDDGSKESEAANKLGGELMAKFGANGKVKGKGRKKKVEEIGPSGQTYTPLEKQFMEIKADNPDVLLFMEGEHKIANKIWLTIISRLQIQVSG